MIYFDICCYTFGHVEIAACIRQNKNIVDYRMFGSSHDEISHVCNTISHMGSLLIFTCLDKTHIFGIKK